MNPVLILQHLSADGPAYLGTWLAAHGVAAHVVDAQAGTPFPETLRGFGGLAVLGGEMSANDPLPSLRQAERLILQALRDGVPTLGHCLGGQLMARALGAAVVSSAAPEIGWSTISVGDSELARGWLGAAGPAKVFQWHSEAFGLPPGAQSLANSPACPHQAFALGPFLAMQFHVELDAEKLERWSRDDALRDLEAARHATVQSGPAMRAEAALHLADQQRLADRIYSRWLAAASAP